MTQFFPNDSCQHYISLLQENITRMASNSANCKTWLVTLLAAICAITDSKGDVVKFIRMAYILTFLFYFLDCFYLGIERRLRRVEKRFIALVTQDIKALKNECQPHDIHQAMYQFSLPEGHKNKHSQLVQTLCAMWSWSTTPFYGCVFGFIFCFQHGDSFCIFHLFY